MSLATPERIRSLQRKLYCKAKAEPAFRFYTLYDKICRADILAHAYEVARGNAGAPGVDGRTFEHIEASGLQEWLAGLHEDLVARTVSADAGAAGDDPKAGRRRTPARHSDDSGSGESNCCQARARTNLRGGLRGHCLWLPSPTRSKRRDQGSAPASLPGPHRCRGCRSVEVLRHDPTCAAAALCGAPHRRRRSAAAHQAVAEDAD